MIDWTPADIESGKPRYIAIAEALAISRDLLLAEETGAAIHFRQVTTRPGLEIVRRAKARGVSVTCGVTPAHFMLSDLATVDFRTFARLSPPLRSEDDRQAVREAIGDGTVDVIGTHEELMGGENSQVYLGCRFPASQRLAGPLGAWGQKLGEWMAREGVVGRFTANFLATPKGGESIEELYAVDVHLRKGNTTLPLRTLQLLSGGRYYHEEGVFKDDRGQELCYLSSDHFGAGQFKGMMPRDLLEIITCSPYHYSSTTHTGAVFHMLNGISELGQTGITCIERRHELAERLYYAVFQELEMQRGGFEWMT